MYQAHAPQSCQICFDAPDPEPNATLLTQLCGPQCKAKICRQCLTSHVRVSLERFYAGIVPRVRCPICLEPMSKSQWQFHLVGKGQEDSKPPELVDRYEMLCRQACGLTSPCCHKADYSHLPKAQENESDADQFVAAVLAIAPSTQPPVIASLWSLSLEFQAYKQPPRVVTKFLLKVFSKTKTMASEALDALLTRVQDDERRAMLLLSFLAARPLCITRCCGHEICFNCKKGSHHRVCDNGQEIDLTANMIQCRSCRAPLVKVEGCSSVTCLCGFNMNWDEELTQFKFMAKKMVSEDVFFNPELFACWLQWRNQAPFRGSAITSAYSAYRAKRLETYLVQYGHMLRPRIHHFVQRWRFHRNVVKRISAAWLQMQVKYYARKLATSHQEQMPEFTLLTADPSEHLSLQIDPIAQRVNNRGSRMAERRDRAQKARKSIHERRQKAQGALTKPLFAKSCSPKEVSGDVEMTKSEDAARVCVKRKFAAKRLRAQSLSHGR